MRESFIHHPPDSPFMREELARNSANHTPLTPLSFLARAARFHGEMPSFVHGGRTLTWTQTQQRCHKLANALVEAGIKPADVVAVMASNTPEFYECMFGVPLMGAIINPINVRLDAAAIAFILQHGEARAVIVDSEFAPVMRAALAQLDSTLLLVQINDPLYDAANTAEADDPLGTDYEEFIKDAAATPFPPPADEWQALSLNYTSGTTGNPKGVVYSHRGAWMIAVGNLTAWQMPRFVAYGWTLPMFHCCGWCFPWSVAAQAGLNIGMRKVSSETIAQAIVAGARRFSGAPIVLSMLIEAMEKLPTAPAEKIHYMVAAAPPPAAVLDKATALGVEVLHAYGLTEVYGPAVCCEWKPAWHDLSAAEQSVRRARQGVPYITLEELTVMKAETMTETPNDGDTMGEVMLRGNAVMRGYFKNPQATAAAFAGGWFHSGDLGVRDADNYVRLKDRAKDVIISGGENISSIEVEDALCSHPDISAAAVVGQPDEKWGEVPLAYVELRPGAQLSEQEIIAFCRDRLAKFKCPKAVRFGEIPRTVTGKVQKFRLRDSSAGE